MTDLKFTESDHRYSIGGETVISVTQVIDTLGLSDFSFVSEDALRIAADRGNKVHKTTELYDRAILNREGLHPTLENYLVSWIKFCRDFNFELLENETMYYHPLYKYAGRIDRIGYCNNKLTLVDIKSGIKTKTQPLQTMAYKMLYDYGKPKAKQIKQRLVVFLSEKGYKIELHEDPSDQSVFLAALTIHNYKKNLR